MTDKAFTNSSLTWDQATFTWDNAGDRTWDFQGPAMTNKSLNTGTMINKAL